MAGQLDTLLKSVAKQVVADLGTSFDSTIVRYQNAFGPDMGFKHAVPHIIERFCAGEAPFKIYSHKQTRAFCYISDSAEGTVLAMENDKANGEIYHIGSTEEISMETLTKEIGKILENIVDFEVFFVNNHKNLDIMIKHPSYDPRPLSMGSGAEKTLASMAIRLALISVTNLPKSELFILDEPATALDQDHMEGFTNLLRIIKNQFKTVILISHLDSLKAIVDQQILIEKNEGKAYVNE